MMNFRTMAKVRKFSNNYFPYSEVGFLAMSLIITFFVWSLLISFVAGISNYLGYFFDDFANQFVDSNKYLDYVYLTFHYVYKFFDWIYIILITIVKILMLLMLILWIIYLVLVVRRWRSYERNVITNDISAYFFKRKLISALNIKHQKKAINHKLNKAQNNSNGSIVDYRDENRLTAFNQMLSMRVFFNTRQALDSLDIVKQVRVIVSLSQNAETDEILFKESEKISKISVRILNGKIPFDDMEITSNQSMLIVRGMVAVPDKYAKRNISDEKVVDDNVYVTSFPYELFDDKQEEIDLKRDSAIQWTSRTALSVDAILSTLGFQFSRVKSVSGATSSQYIYDMAVSSSGRGGNMNSLVESLESSLKIKGITTSFVAGQLQISIPVPVEYNIPINVATMYREVFGDTK